MKVSLTVLFGLLTALVAAQWALAEEPAATDGPRPQTTCPVMGGKINKELFADYDGKRIYFCCPGCVKKFEADPADPRWGPFSTWTKPSSLGFPRQLSPATSCLRVVYHRETCSIRRAPRSRSRLVEPAFPPSSPQRRPCIAA